MFFWVTMVVLIMTMSRYEAFGSINKQYRLDKIPDGNLQWLSTYNNNESSDTR